MQIGYCGPRRADSTSPSGAWNPKARKRCADLPAFAATQSSARARTGRPVLRATNVGVSFGGNVAVYDVSIEVRAGEIVGLIGTNGAGKSTLMNAIGGYVREHRHRRTRGRRRLVAVAVGARRVRVSGARSKPRRCSRSSPSARRSRSRSKRGTAPVCWRPRCASRASFRMERKRRAEADDLIGFLGLGRYADAVHLRSLDRHSAYRRARRDCSRSTRGCSASTNRPPVSPNERPKRPVPSSRRSGRNCVRRCS